MGTVSGAIFEILDGDAALTTSLASRIFPNRIPQNTANPAIIYFRDRTVPMNHKDSTGKGAATIVNHHYIVDIWTDKGKYMQGQTIADEVKAALDRNSGTFDTDVVIDTILYDDQEDGFDNEADANLVSMDFVIREKL